MRAVSVRALRAPARPSTGPETVEGWAAIAGVLGVSRHGAMRRAEWPVDPLPVRVGHRGPWAYVEALRQWVFRQDMAYGVARRLGEAVAAARGDRRGAA